MEFLYDHSGQPYSFTLNNVTYYYILNLQGDIVRLVDGWGRTVASYTYNAWGKLLNTTTTSVSNAANVANKNPLRYRGYYYDAESKLYYLQSRYYDPYQGRFINADSATSTGQGILGYNMYAYCGNNPILNCDPEGNVYSPAEIHNFVVADICEQDENKKGNETYMVYKVPIKRRGKYSYYGFCDVYDTTTLEIWEVKRFGGGSSCSYETAKAQLRNYVFWGILKTGPDSGYQYGGTKSMIQSNTFYKLDKDLEGVYSITYWDAGGGIVYYDYAYFPSDGESWTAVALLAYLVAGYFSMGASATFSPVPVTLPVF